VLGDHFYDFFYSVDKIIVKNPPKEKVAMSQDADREISPKRARLTKKAQNDGQGGSSSTLGNFSAPPNSIGRKVSMPTVVETLEENGEVDKKQGDNEENFSNEESEEISNDLLIDTIVVENIRDQMEGMGSPETLSYEKIMVNSMQIIPAFRLSNKLHPIWML
jgi:hypothetical protein